MLKASEMKDLYIIGAGGFGREVAWLVRRINAIKPTWNLLGFVDDAVEKQGGEEDGYPVLGSIQSLQTVAKDTYVVCAVGSAKVRRDIIDKVKTFENILFATLIDPDAVISDRVKIGKGNIICAGTIVTVDVSIGEHVIVNLDCTIGHDCKIHNFVTVYPSVNLSGMTEVGKQTEIGTGAQVIQGIKICENVIVGAGAVVVKSIGESGTYVGVPAEQVRETV